MVPILGIRERQPFEREKPLARRRKPDARSHDHPQPGCGGQEALDDCRVRGQLLEVVEHHEHPPLPQERLDVVHEIALARLAHAELGREPARDVGGSLRSFQPHERGPVGKRAGKLALRALGEPRLAGAAVTHDREQPALALRHELAHAPQLDGTPDEVRVGNRRRRRRHGDRARKPVLERREVRAGRKPQVFGQPRGKIAIRLPCPGGLAGAREPRQVRPQRGLVERIGSQQPPGEVDALGAIDLLGQGAPARRCATRPAGARARRTASSTTPRWRRRRTRSGTRRCEARWHRRGGRRPTPARRPRHPCRRRSEARRLPTRSPGSRRRPAGGTASCAGSCTQACSRASGHRSAAISARPTQPRFMARYATSCPRRSNGRAAIPSFPATAGAPNRVSGCEERSCNAALPIVPPVALVEETRFGTIHSL